MPSAGDTIYANSFTAFQFSRQSGTYTFTGTSYGVTTTGGTYVDVGVAFTAPLSGAIMVSYNGRLSNSGANSTYLSFAVRTGSVIGSGTAVANADNGSAIEVVGTTAARNGVTHVVSGLTPGSSYNARMEHRVSAGTGTASLRSLHVAPIQ